jgi:hypothetical protein
MYIFINKTDHKLLVTQEFMDDDFIIIDSNSRDNFKWLNGPGEKCMLKILDSTSDNPINEWQWSTPFILNELGSQSIRNSNTDNDSDYMYWKIDRRLQNVTLLA